MIVYQIPAQDLDIEYEFGEIETDASDSGSQARDGRGNTISRRLLKRSEDGEIACGFQSPDESGSRCGDLRLEVFDLCLDGQYDGQRKLKRLTWICPAREA